MKIKISYRQRVFINEGLFRVQAALLFYFVALGIIGHAVDDGSVMRRYGGGHVGIMLVVLFVGRLLVISYINRKK